MVTKLDALYCYLQPEHPIPSTKKIYHFMRRIKVREISEHTVSFLLRCRGKRGHGEAGRDGVPSWFVLKHPRSALTLFLVRSQRNGEGQDAETLNLPSFSQRVWASSPCKYPLGAHASTHSVILQTIEHVDPQASVEIQNCVHRSKM